MKNRRVLCALPFVAILALVPAVSLLSDNNLSIEEARKAVTDLVQLVGPEHDCDISNVALRKVSPADEEYAIYFVSEEPNLDPIHEVNPPVDVGNWDRADGGDLSLMAESRPSSRLRVTGRTTNSWRRRRGIA